MVLENAIFSVVDPYQNPQLCHQEFRISIGCVCVCVCSQLDLPIVRIPAGADGHNCRRIPRCWERWFFVYHHFYLNRIFFKYNLYNICYPIVSTFGAFVVSKTFVKCACHVVVQQRDGFYNWSPRHVLCKLCWLIPTKIGYCSS